MVKVTRAQRSATLKLSAAVLKYRLEKKMTQQEMAKFLKLSQSTISKLENNPGQMALTALTMAMISEKIKEN